MDAIQWWSDVAEIAGGIGVVVTLALLVRQVRDSKRATEENSRLLRAAAFDRGFDQLTGWRGRLIESPEVARLWLRGNQGDALSEEDAVRYAELATDLYMARFASYSRHAAAGNHTLAEHQLGLIAELCTAHPGFRRWFESREAPMRGPIWDSIRARIPSPPAAVAGVPEPQAQAGA